MTRIYYTKPSITEREVRYAQDAALHGWGARCYDYIERFEALFCQHLGVKHAIATSSCTGALHMGLAALGVGPGDEVILPDLSWIATVAPVTYLGARPVLVDVLPHTWCLDPQQVERKIGPRTKAIIAVHLYGNMADMDALLDLGRRHGVPVVEDAAEAIGSQWRGQRAGSLGRFGVFSFHGSKTLTTGEGGLFVTQDEDLYEKVLTLSNHGRSRRQSRQFYPDTIGFKYKMSNLEAAIGCGQLERVDELIARKRAIFEGYVEALAPVAAQIAMNPEPVGTVNGYWMPTLVFPRTEPFQRDQLLAIFREEQVDARVFFWPLSELPSFSPHPQHRVSHSLYSRAVNLPSYHDLSADDVGRIAELVIRWLSDG
ncbi:MAG: DegT/DnrJ/EryC1/StrS family aminotransferase [Magnetococcales bacterium]|nr:DegT/DnrJ/EryC1/StrS family aminotransferase [Magnetococcales bacterium]